MKIRACEDAVKRLRPPSLGSVGENVTDDAGSSSQSALTANTVKMQLFSVRSDLKLTPRVLRPASMEKDQMRLPNTLYDAGPMTLSAFFTDHLEPRSMVDTTYHDNFCPLCRNVTCDYKVLARHRGIHTCADLAHCEAGVRIRLCGHLVGARCLVQHILAGKNECPTCGRVWFRPAVKFIRETALENSTL